MMMDFITGNIATILALLFVAAAVALIVTRMVINRRMGKGGCACGESCKGCAGREICRMSRPGADG